MRAEKKALAPRAAGWGVVGCFLGARPRWEWHSSLRLQGRKLEVRLAGPLGSFYFAFW